MEAFISYCHKDAELLTQLHEHLAALRRQGLIEAWTDRKIPPGGVIDVHVDTSMEQAELYLLLVSSSFIDSNYCMEKEFARALERQQAGQAMIVPIIIRECDWRIPNLCQFKALPEDGKPVISRHWHTPDEGFRNVAEGLRSLLATRSGTEGGDHGPSEVKPRKVKFQPDARHVTAEQRAVLRKLCDEIVDRLTARKAKEPDEVTMKAKGRWFGIVWSQFNERFGIEAHGLLSLPKETFDEGRKWLLQYRASKDKSYKRVNPQKYRNTLTKAIYTLAGKLQWSKPELYAFAARQVGYEGAIESLNDLGNTQLELVKERIRYEQTKRKVKSAQAKARRQTAGRETPDPSTSCKVNVGYLRDSSSTGDVHTYWLTVSFANASPVKQDGWQLELFFPPRVPIDCAADAYSIEPEPATVGEANLRKLSITSRDVIYRGQTVQIVDRERRPLSYKMDHALYYAAQDGAWQLRWNFYAGNMPVMSAALPWENMHEF